ncbi:MAG: hypothetical protein GWN83_15100, partial [Gemmatimonadetes bacterium]|nr:hypothetical protein [Gemmatimonadota bacterium]
RPQASAGVDGHLRGIALRNLGPQYGLDLAVTAYAGVTGTALTIVGTGPEAAQLRR